MSVKKLLGRLRLKLRHLQEQSSLLVALSLVIGVALVLTTVSVSLYSFSGVSKLDLSRPGFEREREEVRQTQSQKAYDSTSPVTSGAIDEFLKEYDERANDLKQYGDFRDQALDDASLLQF